MKSKPDKVYQLVDPDTWEVVGEITRKELENSDWRTVEAVKQHKDALRELYEYAQKAGEIRSDMLQKITDLERCAQAHEAWIIEQEEKQWKD